MDTASITAKLDACLLDVDETGRIDTGEWRDGPAPLAEWPGPASAETTSLKQSPGLDGRSQCRSTGWRAWHASAKPFLQGCMMRRLVQ
jgi:hypothetical protein